MIRRLRASARAVAAAVLCCCTPGPAFRISLLTCGATGIRTPDLLHAIQRQPVHPRVPVQVAVLPRPLQSARVQACCGTFLLYRRRTGQSNRSRPWQACDQLEPPTRLPLASVPARPGIRAEACERQNPTRVPGPRYSLSPTVASTGTPLSHIQALDAADAYDPEPRRMSDSARYAGAVYSTNAFRLLPARWI
jgi:hypothetical protein